MFQRFLATAVAGATLAAGTVVGLGGSTAATASAASCPSGSWGTETVGRPPAAHAGTDGAAIWRTGPNTDVFHLRMSQPNHHGAVFSGSITTDGVLVYHGARLERGDVSLRRSPHKFVYAFTNFGAVDGFDVAALCASYVNVSVRENTHWMPLSHIVIGAADTHPSANPVHLAKS